MPNNTFFNTWFYPIFIGVVVLLQLVLMVHGFDVCDEGFSLTFYQQFFNSPESVEYCFVYWLSGLVGGIWYRLNETGGVLWFRVLTIIFNTATLMLCYGMLKHLINRYYVMIGLAMVLFVNDFGFLAFYHNHLTAFLAVLGAYVLLKGLEHNKLILLFLSGCILGVNIFSRLPNITLLIFVLAIPYAIVVLRKKSFLTALKPILVMLFGSVMGVALVILAMHLLNQWHIMENAFEVLFILGKTDDSGHNIMALIRVIKYNYLAIFFEACKLTLVTLVVLVLYRFLKTKIIFKTILSGMALVLFYMLFAKGDIYVVYVLGFVGTLGAMLTQQNTERIKILAFLALLIMVFLPLGSGGGVHSSGYICIWLAIPFFFHFVSKITKINVLTEIGRAQNALMLDHKPIRYLLPFLVLSYFGYKGYSMSQGAYFDSGNRLDKTAVIDNAYTKGVYTTEERAKVINDVLIELEKYVAPNDYLLMYDSAPMLHFLTETKPYAYNPWVWIYDHVSFENKLSTAEANIKDLPIVVQQKFTTIWEFSSPMDDYLSEDKTYSNTYHPGRAKAMNDFLRRHNYKIIWSNAYFNIYEPSNTLTTE